MKTLINGTCYEVSTNVLYRLGFLRHTNLPVYTSDPSKCPRDVREGNWKGKVNARMARIIHAHQKDMAARVLLTGGEFGRQAEAELFGLRTLFCLRDGDLVVTIT